MIFQSHTCGDAREPAGADRSAEMSVIVVGGGIAGLCAAIGLRRAGHRVRLFERTATATAFGAGVVIGYNASKVLTAWGFDFAANGLDVSEDMVMFKGDTMEEIRSFNVQNFEEMAGGHRQYFGHRVDVQQALLRMATQSNGDGIPVELKFNAPVFSYEVDEGSITLEDGSKHTADLVVAADGVHSTAPRYVLGSDEYDVSLTGTTIIRFMLMSEAILSDATTARLLERKGRFSWFIGSDLNRWLLQYPVRNNTEVNYGMYSLVDGDHEANSQALRFKCDRGSLQSELEGFHESILALVPKTSDILPVWKLQERPPLPTWHRGKLVVVGDAAHAMLPNQGQGAGMCIEDAGALGVLFSQMPDTSASTIETRLDLFTNLRRPRASAVQIMSHFPYHQDTVKLTYPELLKLLPSEELPNPGDREDIRRWLFTYDLLKDSQKALKEHKHTGIVKKSECYSNKIRSIAT